MKNFLIPFFALLLVLYQLTLQAQMQCTVNSLADDSDAHPYDDPETMDDETMDGLCEDYLGRCTLRAALEEASYLDIGADVVFSVSGILSMDENQGAFYPPDESLIKGLDQNVTIFGANFNTSVIFVVGNHTLITGLHLINALIGIDLSGSHSRIGLDNPMAANYISGMSQNGIIITGDSNRVTGNVIGLDIAGLAEGSPFGVFVFGNGNVVGGMRAGEGNIISGNDKGIMALIK
jgi:CSLREA domain-containing protein